MHRIFSWARLVLCVCGILAQHEQEIRVGVLYISERYRGQESFDQVDALVEVAMPGAPVGVSTFEFEGHIVRGHKGSNSRT